MTEHTQHGTTTSPPETMRAAVYRRFGGPDVVEVVESVPRPRAGVGDVLIRVRASTVSVADQRMRSRRVPRGLGLLVGPALGFFRPRRRILGMDVAGVVDSVGPGVTEFTPGDEVIALRGQRFGGHAEYVTAPATGAIALKPRNLSFEEAATLVFGGHTAVSFLDLIELRERSEVLVNGASGAVGTAVIQLAARQGARVTAVCSGGNADLVRSLGADTVIDYARQDFADTDARYDAIIECVGNAPFARVAPLVRPGGAILNVITDLAGMLAAKRRSRRSGILVACNGAPVSGDTLRRLTALAEAGDFRPVIDRVYDLDDIADAHRYVDTGRKRGNVVLRISQVRSPRVQASAAWAE
ncbi:MAG TPA: NAD(P)-dependent alcohol dehydrogenase [Microbacterium sp.]|uniref:NAD(P)-dependent alcohol dehydrogenase n=1 Tax=Microbacterium sp. TaxID=51671 RepID=UPI002B9BAE1F|nr:NAD(P)-dependent alcohol dehydrogenase [Microbacterium sp.]HWI30304.1 NAD(P)-dependent alcohol dehydrogenase [Microbacterium sp.]